MFETMSPTQLTLLLLRRGDTDAHVIGIIVGLVGLLIAIPFGLIEKARKDRQIQQREEARIASIAALDKQETQPKDLHLPKSAAKYIWGYFYAQRPAATFIYLKTNGARMQRQARMVAVGVDENGDGVLGCFENGQFRVFYVDRIRDLTPIENR